MQSVRIIQSLPLYLVIIREIYNFPPLGDVSIIAENVNMDCSDGINW